MEIPANLDADRRSDPDNRIAIQGTSTIEGVAKQKMWGRSRAIVKVEGDTIHFADGTAEAYDVVIAAFLPLKHHTGDTQVHHLK